MTDRSKILTRVLQWQPGPDASVIYRTAVPDEAALAGTSAHWAIRLNDFPRQSLYTLLIEGQPVLDFDDWPAAWQRPPGTDAP